MNVSSTLLRPYARDSAESAARIVALTLIANGRIKAAETAALDALRAHQRLGLTRLQWIRVIDELCTDLLDLARGTDEVFIRSELLQRMLDEIDDGALRRLVLSLCSAAVHADRQIDDGESFVLRAAIERWGLHLDDQPMLEPVLYGADFQVRPRSIAAAAGHKLRLC